MANLGWVRTARSAREHRAYRNAATALCGVRLGESPVWTNRFREPCAECQGRDPERAEFIEFIIDYLADAQDLVIPSASIETERIRPRFFDGAEPFLRTDLTHGGEDGFLNTGLEPQDVSWPLDLSVLSRAGSEGDGAFDHTGWYLARYRSLDAKATRGRVYPALPYPTEWTYAVPADKFVHRWIIGRAGPQRWTSINRAGTARQQRLGGDGMGSDFWTERMLVALEIWKRRPQQWRVYFAMDGKPGIELPSDPVGVRAAFRLRDIPAGKSRRTALLHWVTEHWRANRSDPREEVLVREHLAGQRAFNWGGLTCKITPSRVDQARADEAAERRQEARLVGADRRAVERAP